MNNENYINIQGWMINELKLKGNELILYAIIYGFSQDGENQYHGSIRYITKAMAIAPKTVARLLTSLRDKGLIISEENGNDGRLHSVVKVTTPKGMVKVSYKGSQNVPKGVVKSSTNNNKYNNKDTNKVATKVADSQDSPFLLIEEVKKLQSSKRRDMKIIGFYMAQKLKEGFKLGESIKTKKNLQAFIARHVKSAKEIADAEWTGEQILKAHKEMLEEVPNINYTIGTWVKYLTK